MSMHTNLCVKDYTHYSVILFSVMMHMHMYKGNSKSKVPYFIPTERIPALSWQAWVQLVHIFTTTGETRIVDQRTLEFSSCTTVLDLTVLPQP
jgi:hypothetical protein